jgi:predicted DNA-binding transcriptional regulator YafY
LLKEYHYRWYLIGLNDSVKELRTYALDRIIEIKAIDQDYIPKRFKASDYFRNSIGVIAPIGEPPLVKIEVLKPQALYLVTQPLHSSQYVDYEDENKIRFAYHVHATYEFISLILGMGSDMKVVEQVSLAEKTKNQLQQALRNYSD